MRHRMIEDLAAALSDVRLSEVPGPLTWLVVVAESLSVAGIVTM